jgi:hypothetical protein
MAAGGGVRIRGGVGEVWVSGTKAGLVYDWRLRGWAREFQFEAERYKLDPLLVRGREVELRLEIGGGVYFSANGHIWTEYIADGKTHPAITIKGGTLQWQEQVAARPTAG